MCHVRDYSNCSRANVCITLYGYISKKWPCLSWCWVGAMPQCTYLSTLTLSNCTQAFAPICCIHRLIWTVRGRREERGTFLLLKNRLFSAFGDFINDNQLTRQRWAARWLLQWPLPPEQTPSWHWPPNPIQKANLLICKKKCLSITRCFRRVKHWLGHQEKIMSCRNEPIMRTP